MIHYLIITREFPPQDGGIAAVAYEMAKHFKACGCDVTVLGWQYPAQRWPAHFKDAEQSFSIFRIPQARSRWKQIWDLCSAITRIHRQKSVHRILATSWNFSGAAAAWFGKIPFFVLTHGYEVSSPALSRIDRWLMRHSLLRAKKIFAVSHFTKDMVEREIPGKAVCYVPNGVDAERFRPDLETSRIREQFGLREKKVLLTVARLFPRKGHDKVIEAMPEILKQIPNAYYWIIGTGPDRPRLEALVKSKGLETAVGFSGFVQNEDLPACYAACDLFVLPNREIHNPKDPWVGDFEGFGVAFIEASACGKPVIGGRSGGASDAVIDGETGWLVDPDNVSELAEKVILLMGDQTLYARMSRAARRRAVEELHWPVLLQRFQGLLNTV